MMDDFNAAMNSVESGMTRTDAKAGTAQQTADAAKRTADAAFSPNKMPYRVGSYVGDGSPRTVYLGFRPSFLVISGAVEDSSGNSAPSFTSYTCVTAGQVISSRVAFTDNGFTVMGTDGRLPNFSDAGRTYDYIAFR